MNKIFGYAIVIAILAVPVMSFAAEFRSGDQASVGVDEHIADDLYIAGDTVTSAGTVEGDLIAAGEDIVISGNVGEDVTAAGSNVNIFGEVGDDARVGGGTIIVEGLVVGDLIAGGSEVTIRGSGVAGDVVIGGGDIRIDAPIIGKLTVRAGSVFINAPIVSDINIEADVVKLGSFAVITGNLSYKAKKELTMESGAVVNGKITFEPIAEKNISGAGLAAIFSAFLVWQFFALLASALVIGLLLRRYSKEIVTLAVSRPFMEIGRGLVILVAMPIISVLLLMTLVGIPFGVLGLLGYVALLLFSCIMTPIIVGSVVYRYFSKKDLEVSWKTVLTGVVVYVLLGLVPFIGWLAQVLLMMLALGAILSLKWRILKEWR